MCHFFGDFTLTDPSEVWKFRWCCILFIYLFIFTPSSELWFIFLQNSWRIFLDKLLFFSPGLSNETHETLILSKRDTCFARTAFCKRVQLIAKLCTGFINPFLNKLTISGRNGRMMGKKGDEEGAAALKMFIIQMRQSVPAWCQCHHSSNYYHGNAPAMENHWRAWFYLVKAITYCD